MGCYGLSHGGMQVENAFCEFDSVLVPLRQVPVHLIKIPSYPSKYVGPPLPVEPPYFQPPHNFQVLRNYLWTQRRGFKTTSSSCCREVRGLIVGLNEARLKSNRVACFLLFFVSVTFSFLTKDGTRELTFFLLN